MVGTVAIQMLANVKQTSIFSPITSTIMAGILVYTDECDIYNRVSEWGYGRETVCHSRGEYGRDEDGAGYVLIVVSLRNYYQTILGSSSSRTTRNGAAKNFCSSCFGYSSTTNLESNVRANVKYIRNYACA
uniref:ISXO2-like transposase domain-containing protein n=2 Tax=Candidatus Kentrum eta TaxID=2126337 RepID=A0A450V644_9GAMM|nr:MAG: hypothetical protein BECKH772A_GA0070896_101862 [Candidatus Kentron sp. H]